MIYDDLLPSVCNHELDSTARHLTNRTINSKSTYDLLASATFIVGLIRFLIDICTTL